jgi:hypothetical protein
LILAGRLRTSGGAGRAWKDRLRGGRVNRNVGLALAPLVTEGSTLGATISKPCASEALG